MNKKIKKCQTVGHNRRKKMKKVKDVYTGPDITNSRQNLDTPNVSDKNSKNVPSQVFRRIPPYLT